MLVGCLFVCFPRITNINNSGNQELDIAKARSGYIK